jgi:glutaredoxin
MRRLDLRTLLSTLLVLGALATPMMALAGDVPCASTQAANDLRSCCYCSEIKNILSDPEFEGVSFDVTALRTGATVRMQADQAAAQLLLQDFTTQMWGAVKLDGDEQVCDYCQKRRAQLDHVIVDWSVTSDGVQLVLISEEPKFAEWVLGDAQKAQSWVLSSAGN